MLTGASVSPTGDTRAKQALEPAAVWKPELSATQATGRIPFTGIPEQIAEIETKFGKIYLEFLPDVAPKTVANFKKLASSGFYNGTTFHRVIPRFVIQGGDPNSKDDDRANDGLGGPGWSIPAEFNNTEHARGVVSMARSNQPDSAGSQFFICLERLPQLDQKYTAFAKVIHGMDVVDKIAAVNRDSKDNPMDKIEMRVRLVNRDAVGLSGD
ncbi:MAG: peptidylprolyl isomerase [Candidatus Coatesbacteria bacterium]|nr:peptidylprolyl isomerase [Candidatus Coatesbacteria bacterium]